MQPSLSMSTRSRTENSSPSGSPQPQFHSLASSSMVAMPSTSLGITPHLTSQPEVTTTLPTVIISHKGVSGATRTVKARIDRNVPLAEVIRQLCTSTQLSVSEPSALFALRDSFTNELITSENVFHKVEAGNASFKLVSSPTIEAAESVEKLATRDDRAMKLALFSLKDFLREREFTDEFLARGGDQELLSICRAAPISNTLAYALSALQVLTELDYGWETLDAELVARLASILTHSTAVNALRPATALLKRLVSVGPSARPPTPFSAQGPAKTIYKYGFDAVWPACTLEEDFLRVLARRISSGGQAEFGLASATLALVNALMKASLTSSAFEEFDDSLERAEMRKAVVRLMEHQRGEELLPLVLAFQSNVNAAAHALVTMPVKAEHAGHVGLLMDIASKSRAMDARIRLQAASSGVSHLSPEEATDVEMRQWKTAGFENENLLEDFNRVGVLGLKLMGRFVVTRNGDFEKMMLEQLGRPEAKRCPFAKASNECTEIMCELWDWNTTDAATAPSTAFQPFLFQYPKAHALALKFFFLIWTDSGATLTDFARVGVLVRTQVKSALRHEGRSWSDVTKEFEEVDYTRVRDKQMQELALEDDLLSKPCVRNLRSRLYQESFEFVQSQRIQALIRGNWFLHNPSQSLSPHRKGPAQSKVWRFYRLAANRKYLHYTESSEKIKVLTGTESMPDKLEISAITDVAAAGPVVGSASSTVAASRPTPRSGSIRFSSYSSASDGTFIPNGVGLLNGFEDVQRVTPLTYTFSLMAGDALLAELTAQDLAVYSEWVDGLSLLRSDGYISTRETADLIHSLTHIGTQIKLLDLSGERVDVPSKLEVPPVPISTAFFYADNALSTS